MKKRTREYDSFGPAMHIIDDYHTIPKVFVDHYKPKESPLLLFKIPRNIERREANPDMDLYDYLIGVFKTHLLILKREGKRVKLIKIDISDIVAIKKTNCLLRGELYIYTKSDTILIVYNTVSDNIIVKTLNLIRTYYQCDKVKLNIEPMPFNYMTIGFLHTNLINALKKQDAEIELVAYQPNIKIKQKNQSLISKILSLFSFKNTLNSTVFVTNNKELIIVEGESFVKTKKGKMFFYSHLYLPINQIEKINIINDPENAEIKHIIIKTKNQDYKFIIDDSNIGLKELARSIVN
jgi:hypothetical protein